MIFDNNLIPKASFSTLIHITCPRLKHFHNQLVVVVVVAVVVVVLVVVVVVVVGVVVVVVGGLIDVQRIFLTSLYCLQKFPSLPQKNFVAAKVSISSSKKKFGLLSDQWLY